MSKKLEIPFGEYKIVAEINAMNLPEIPPELFVCICDKNNNWVQDICMVRQTSEYGGTGEAFKSDNKSVDCLVWSDPNNEDFTHDFTIDVCEEEEE